MQNYRRTVYILMVDFGGGLHFAKDMLHGLMRICCMGWWGYVAWVDEDMLHGSMRIFSIVAGGKKSQILVLRLKTEVWQNFIQRNSPSLWLKPLRTFIKSSYMTDFQILTTFFTLSLSLIYLVPDILQLIFDQPFFWPQICTYIIFLSIDHG